MQVKRGIAIYTSINLFFTAFGLSRCLEDGTRIDLSLSEISDEEVDYGSSASIANSDTAPDSSWTPL